MHPSGIVFPLLLFLAPRSAHRFRTFFICAGKQLGIKLLQKLFRLRKLHIVFQRAGKKLAKPLYFLLISYPHHKENDKENTHIYTGAVHQIRLWRTH